MFATFGHPLWRLVYPGAVGGIGVALQRRYNTVAFGTDGQPSTGAPLTATKIRTGRFKFSAQPTDVIYATEAWMNDNFADTNEYKFQLEDNLGVVGGDLYINVVRVLPPTENDTTVSRTTNRIIFIKNNTDSAANVTIAERPICQVPENGLLVKATFTPDASVAADASNFGSMIIAGRNGRGGAPTTLASWSTQTSAQGALTSGKTVDMSLLASVAGRQMFSSSILTFQQTKTGTGVVLPSGVFQLFYIIMNRFDGILGITPTLKWDKDTTDAAAITATAETPVLKIPTPCSLNVWNYTANAGITANATDFGTAILSKYDNVGANKVTVASIATSSTGVTANVSRTGTLGITEARRFRAGDVLTFEITKAGLGVVFPSGTFDITLAALVFGNHRIVQIDSDDGAAADTISEFPVFIAPESRTLSSAWYAAGTTVTQDAANYGTLTFSRRDGAGGGATASATYSTQTGANGTATANIPALFTNGSGTAFTVGQILTWQTSKTGTGVVLRAGEASVNWAAETIKTDGWIHYADDAAASTALSQRSFFTPQRESIISAIKICLKTTIAADATDYVVFTVKRRDNAGNSTETLGTWSTQSGQNGAITAMIPVSMTLTSTTAALSVAPGDNVTVEYAKFGAGKTVSQGVVQLDYTQPSLLSVPADPVGRTIFVEYDSYP